MQGAEEAAAGMSDLTLSGKVGQQAEAPAEDAAASHEKEIRKLKKKLRQIDDLQASIDQGKAQPTPEQRAKLDSRQGLVDALAALEASA